MRYDNKTVGPTVVNLVENTATYAAAVDHKFVNVEFKNPGSTSIHCRDHFMNIPREWVNALPKDINPPFTQAQMGEREYVLKVTVDFEREHYTADEWKNMLLVPITTKMGTWVLQVAGKQDKHCFSIVDEELLVLAGQNFVHMVMQYNLMSKVTNLMAITSVDTADISIEFLKDKALGLAKADRGAIFCIDGEKEQIYFMADMADGSKKEIRLPLRATSMVGNCILSKEVINIPDCYQDSRFNQSTDIKTGYRTKQLLCVPVTTRDGQVIAAIQVINSHSGMAFSQQDVEYLQAFRVYVQVALNNVKIRELGQSTRHSYLKRTYSSSSSGLEAQLDKAVKEEKAALPSIGEEGGTQAGSRG